MRGQKQIERQRSTLTDSAPWEHPRIANGIHAANVGSCECPIQKVV